MWPLLPQGETEAKEGELMERKVRSIVKALTWRAIATITTSLIVFGLTQSVELAGKALVLDAFIKLFLYYLHERGWTKIEWGTNEGHPRLMLDGLR